MKNTDLTLKNIYRACTKRDYPLYSDDILPAKDRRGLTVLKFWDGAVLSVFKAGWYGKILWNMDQEQNRYLSDLVNRGKDFPYNQVYFREIMAQLSQEQFLKQLCFFAAYLRDRHYRADVFRVKMIEMLQMFHRMDADYPEAADRFLRHYQTAKRIPQDFLDGWLMTALFFHAVAGPEMDSVLFLPMRQTEDYLPETLYALYRAALKERQELPVFGPGDGQERSVFAGRAVPAMQFVGRETFLFELFEQIAAHEKILISGIGGIGKTEVLRQVYASMVRERKTVFAVPFEESLAESFARTIPGIPGGTAEEIFREILFRLKQEGGEDSVVLMDDADWNPSEEAFWEELSSVPCAVIVTARVHALPGFQTRSLEELSPEASALLLRGYFGRALSAEEKECLPELSMKKELRYPLLLQAVGKTARYHGWSVRETIAEIQNNFGSFRWKEADAEYRITQIFHSLYKENTLKEDETDLIRLMAVLPYRDYEAEVLAVAAGILPDGAVSAEERCEKILSGLAERGWLDGKEEGTGNGMRFSIHPLIAESVRSHRLTEAEFPAFLAFMKTVFPAVSLRNLEVEMQADPYHPQWAGNLLYAVRQLQGPVSGELFDTCLSAAWQILKGSAAGQTFSDDLGMLLSRTRTATWEQKAMVQVIRCIHENYRIPEVKACIEEGFRRVDAWDTFATVCMILLPRLAEQESSREYAAAKAEMLRARSDRPEVRMLVYDIALSAAISHGDAEKTIAAFSSMREAYHSCRQKGIIVSDLMQVAWTNTVFLLYAIHQEADTADRLYAEYWKEDIPCRTFDANILRLRMQCNYEDAHGNSAGAALFMQEVLRRLERHSGKRNRTWRISGCDLAFYLRKDGRYEEAIRQYEKLIADEEDQDMNPDYRPLLLYNAGFCFMEAGKEERAEELFLASRNLARERSETFVYAHACYGLARISRVKGQMQEEEQYLREAVPLFMKIFGASYERTRYMTERIRELEEERT